MELRDQTFEGETVKLDGMTLVNCHFKNCKIVIAAEAPHTSQGCKFEDCEWIMSGHAMIFVDTLRKLYAEGAPQIVEDVIAYVRGEPTTQGILH